MKNTISLLVLLIITVSTVVGQDNRVISGLDAITIDALKAQTGFLASDWTEGRETGTKGAYMSADYLASMLQLYGVKPAGDIIIERDQKSGRMVNRNSYFQNFSLTSSSPGPEQVLTTNILEDGVLKTIPFENNIDFIVSPAHTGGKVEAKVVFVGYGYSNPEFGYDDFQGLDIEGKIVLRISGLPESKATSGFPKSSYWIAGEKDALAIEKGAAGIIEVDPENIDGSIWAPIPEFLNAAPSENRSRRRGARLRIPEQTYGKFVPKVSVSVRVANTILKGSGIDILRYVSGTTNKIKAHKEFNNSVMIKTSVIRSAVKARNVIGVIEGKSKEQVIVLGAHYDHVGMSNGYIFNGADDNASGTVGVLTIARAIAASGVKPDKTIILGSWTGEEKGLLGSKYFVNNPTVPLKSIRLYVNFDMISRYMSDDDQNGVIMFYSETYPEFRAMTEKNLSTYKIELKPDYRPSASPPLGSDHRSFLDKGIPVMRFKPGHREEYHTPADESSILDWNMMQKIVKVSFLNIWDLAFTDW